MNATTVTELINLHGQHIFKLSHSEQKIMQIANFI